MTSPDDRIEPGDTVTLVGYVHLPTTTWESDTWVASIIGPVTPDGFGDGVPVVIGPVTIVATGLQGYLSHRISLEFVLNPDQAPGRYSIGVFNDHGELLGDLIGGFINVGVDPEWPTNHEWPLDEPLVDDLPDEAVIQGPGFAVTAGQLRAGIYPAGAEQFMYDPGRLDDPGIVTTTSPSGEYVVAGSTDQPGATTPITSTVVAPVDTSAAGQVEPIAASTIETGSVGRTGWPLGTIVGAVTIGLIGLMALRAASGRRRI